MFNLFPVPVPDLSGKVVLVTGAGRGIGATLVQVLLDHGARVFAGHVEPTVPDSAATWLPLDVTSQPEVDAAVARLSDAAGRLDALVNNAGIITPIGPIADLDSDDLAAAYAVNVIGLHRVTRACLPLLTASGGVVVNAGTGAATQAMEGWTAYCASKAGARMMTQLCALEMGARGVKFFFLGIPPTDTVMQGEIREAGLNPISRIPQADLVPPAVPASVMAWLCGPEARTLDEVLIDVRDDRFAAMMGGRRDGPAAARV